MPPVPRYPRTNQGQERDDYFTTVVRDPYRWMESDRSSQLENWIRAQNTITKKYLEQIPYRRLLRNEIRARSNYPRYSIPVKKNDHYFYSHNSGLQNQSVLYMCQSFNEEPVKLIDPNQMSEDGTSSLGTVAISKDGRYLAWALSRAGSDWQEVSFTDMTTGEQLEDVLKWLKFSNIAWFEDGIFYSRYDEPKQGKELVARNEFQKVYYHKLGEPQEKDRLVFQNVDEAQRNFTAEVDEEENWLFLYETESTYGNCLYAQNLREQDAPLITIFPDFSAETTLVTVKDGKFYLKTDYQAPNGRLVEVDPSHPEPQNWKDILAERDSLLENVTRTGDRLLATWLVDASSSGAFFDFSGKELQQLQLPGLGVCSVSGSGASDEYFFSFTSYTQPGIIYRGTGTAPPDVLFNTLPKDYNSGDYETTRVWFTSKDGTRCPMFITMRKGLDRNGTNPTLLYGYGGFNICMKPSFSAPRTVFLDHGGILAVPILRGGGEYGKSWHEAGTKLQKQNVFDDCIAAAEYLIAEKYTSNQHLAIHGGSNGGLLVGAVMTQRPDLFKAAVPVVGVLDMLRYQKFTIGWAWADDYGTSDDNREMFEYLYAYSPLHNVKKGVEYPATLAITGDHDDRVVPAHSYKFIATLQANGGRANPYLLRVDTRTGHGRGKPLSKIIDESADMFSFILFQLGASIETSFENRAIEELVEQLTTATKENADKPAEVKLFDELTTNATDAEEAGKLSQEPPDSITNPDGNTSDDGEASQESAETADAENHQENSNDNSGQTDPSDEIKPINVEQPEL
ncbi:MAG: prolyl oligopeptidase family serine peptidase [Planctomycetia bacterium]|nr:prolyl oligopeptidase family serine peptidase [Planctomycetia bacterium]